MLKRLHTRYTEWRTYRHIETRMRHKMPVSRYLFDRWVQRALVGYVILFLGFLGNSFVDRQRTSDSRKALAESARVVTTAGCNRDFRIIQKSRAVFTRAEAAIKQQRDAGLVTEQQYRTGIKFYKQQLADAPLPDCRLAGSIITTDPDKAKTLRPRPLYVGSPDENK